MAEKLEVKIIGRDVVKPSSPTPAHLRRFKLSVVDQMAEGILTPFTFLYSSNGNMNFGEKCGHLKSSLSRTLSVFYPIAGRMRESCWIDCCDDGAEFVEAELNCPLSQFFGVAEPDLLRPLVPVNVDIVSSKTEFLCIVQATLLECGGLAICVCLTHKICDGATFMSFMQAWATIARESDSGSVKSPDLSLALLLPPNPDHQSPTITNHSSSSSRFSETLIARSLFFSASKLEELQAIASSNVVDKPTRVEAVSGLIWKCAMMAAAANRSSSSSSSSSSTVQHSAVGLGTDLRRRLVPLVSDNTVGNLLGMMLATTTTTRSNDISKLVIALRREKEVYYKRFEGITSGKEIVPLLWFQALSEIVSKVVDMDHLYMITSICGLPIHFDFGWGKPKFVIPILFVKNVVMLMDMEDLRGVHAYVMLEEQEMNFFQNDPDLLSFASITPIKHKSRPKSKL